MSRFGFRHSGSVPANVGPSRLGLGDTVATSAAWTSMASSGLGVSWTFRCRPRLRSPIFLTTAMGQCTGGNHLPCPACKQLLRLEDHTQPSPYEHPIAGAGSGLVSVSSYPRGTGIPFAETFLDRPAGLRIALRDLSVDSLEHDSTWGGDQGTGSLSRVGNGSHKTLALHTGDGSHPCFSIRRFVVSHSRYVSITLRHFGE